jgi:threonine synthase
VRELGSPYDAARQVCPTCGAAYAQNDPRWRCDDAGHEPLRLSPGTGLRPADIDTSTGSLWRYRRALRVPPEWAASIGEGGTPLVSLRWNGATVAAKLDFLMPTGSFKDRGAALVVAHLRRCGVVGVAEDSSGNAGASYAAFTATAGLACTIYAPADTSPAKRRQIEIYGANLRLVEGTREETAVAARSHPTDIGVYGGHNWQPFFIEGCKTLAYEIWEGLGFQAPDSVVVPIGGGANLLGLHVGFSELLVAGSISKLPRLYGVQAAACAPLAAAFLNGKRAAVPVSPGPTIAEGIRITNPPRGAQILAAVRETGGGILAVGEFELLESLKRLLRGGIAVEPTSAVALAGLTQLVDRNDISPGDERVVVALTGHWLKSSGQSVEAVASAG